MGQGTPAGDARTRLSERQRECLLLLGSGLAPKEVASHLDLSVETVHAHLKAARRTLGVSTSREAARQLAADHGRQSMGNHDLGMAASGYDRAPEAQETGASAAPGVDQGDEVRDSWSAPQRARPRIGWRPEAARGRLDGLSPLQRVLAIMILLTAGVVVIAGLLSVAFGLQQMLWSIYFRR